MRQLYFIVILFTYFTSASAAPKITLKNNNGDWLSSASWDLNRLPQSGDTVVIPSGFTAIVNSNINIPSTDLFVKVYGVLRFVSGGAKLVLGSNSVIVVYENALITSTSSPSQIISIGGVTKYEGDGATIVGPVMASSSTGNGFTTSSSVLPVKFLSFKLTQNNGDILVQWLTTSEVNADYYSVERSFDGSNWASLVTIPANNKQKEISSYSFNDKQPIGSTIYYRIRQVDNNGAFAYTGIKTIKKDEIRTGVIKATVSGGNVILHFEDQIKRTVLVRLIALNGAVLSTQSLNQPSGLVVLTSHIKGQCIISIVDGFGLNISKLVIL
jgi:hypothetical protein